VHYSAGPLLTNLNPNPITNLNCIPNPHPKPHFNFWVSGFSE